MKLPLPCLGFALALALVGCGTTSAPAVTPTPTPPLATTDPMPSVKPDDSYEADDHGHVTSPQGDDILDKAGHAIEDATHDAERAMDRMMR